MIDNHSISDNHNGIHSSDSDNNKVYYLRDSLTIENDEGTKTMRVSQWLTEDPVTFDKWRRANNVRVNSEVFDILVSKLKAYHHTYFIEALGLKTRIKFKDYDLPVQAIVPYSNKPLEFYKWWCSNQELVTMSLKEKIILFQKVFIIKPGALKREHMRIINKK
jgi:ATP-dependent DNA helicase RecQ